MSTTFSEINWHNYICCTKVAAQMSNTNNTLKKHPTYIAQPLTLDHTQVLNKDSHSVWARVR